MSPIPTRKEADENIKLMLKEVDKEVEAWNRWEKYIEKCRKDRDITARVEARKRIWEKLDDPNCRFGRTLSRKNVFWVYIIISFIIGLIFMLSIIK